MGGSIGIGVTSTMVARTTQSYRATMVQHLTPTDPAFTSAIDSLSSALRSVEPDPAHAHLVANALISNSVDRQAAMLGYLGQFEALAIAFLLLVPVVISMRRPARATRPPVVTE
jgi:DHA2 family multidrug resistance protein